MRLIGDDRQPAEGEASMSLRDGDRAALGFYLDNDRVYVGDVASCLDDVFDAWSRERAGGCDCLMLGPTRELVRELNLRAQASRGVVGGSVGIADGCSAHEGDVVISRRDRRLGVSGTDWVKNGDRWIVTDVRADDALSVRHATSRLHATLPAAYVRKHVELGYASTVHTAQGITTDVVHGIVGGTEVLEGILALATSQMRANPDFAEPSPLPWLAGIPSEVATHSAWGPYLAARSRRISSLAAEVAADPVLPERTAKYDDVLTPELRRELAVWRAATGVPVDERTMLGPVPHDDREAAYHRKLTNRINARYGEAVKTWADRIVEYVGNRDEQTAELARYLNQLARKGIDAERVLDLAAARKPLPVDHPTAALAYRIRDLATPRKQRRPAPSIDPFPRSPQHDSGPSLGL